MPENAYISLVKSTLKYGAMDPCTKTDIDRLERGAVRFAKHDYRSSPFQVAGYNEDEVGVFRYGL